MAVTNNITRTKKVEKDYLAAENNPYVEGRIPPHSRELEEAVLGAILLEREKLSLVFDVINEKYFYFPQHQVIYQSIAFLFMQNSAVDLLTVNNDLRNKSKLEEAGGSYYLAQLTNKVASAANIEFYARLLTQKYIQRELIRVSGQIATSAFDDAQDSLELLNNSEMQLYEIKNQSLKRSFNSIESLIGKVLEELSERSNEENEGITGIPSGFLELDRFTAGWQKSDLVILAARPGMGKTALALSLLRNAVRPDRKGNQRAAMMFSLEMSDVQLVQRMVSAEVEISGDQIKKGQLTDQEWRRLHRDTQTLSQSKIFIDDSPQLEIMDLIAKCRRVHSQHGLDIIIVDYLQLLKHGSLAGNREQEIAAISRQLKALAKELNIPVIALAQLSREVEKRGNKKPQLSDLRESGSIEQDADLVLFIYREEYYEKTGNAPEKKGRDQIEDMGVKVPGLTCIIVAKNRHGSVGEANVKFVAEFSKFQDLSLNERRDMGMSNQDMDFSAEVRHSSRINADDPFGIDETASGLIPSNNNDLMGTVDEDF